jgi:phospholipid/cholesterol/gamma-HCH transport system substrate-binding protein
VIDLLSAALRRLRWGLLLAVVLVLGVVMGRALVQPGTYEVTVPVHDAAGLYAGSDVMIAGAKVGSVRSISLAPSSALVTVVVDAEHAPVHTDATIAVRPKSLLGERYLALDPGQAAATLTSGATLPATSVIESTTLEDVVNTFDEPTRAKLQTLVVELGGGVAGRGQQLNSYIVTGRQDLADLKGIADALATRDAELRDVIANLDSVTQELARSDRRQQLGQLIQNLEALMQNLAGQETQLQAALTETNAALSRTSAGLDGTGGNLADIVHALPQTVHLADLIMADLGPDSDALMPHLAQLNQAIANGPSVFGGMDANGFATRISPSVGCATLSLCPHLGGTTPTPVSTVRGSAIDFLLGNAGVVKP